MTEYVVFTREQYEAGIAEMASNMFHGGFLTRRAIGDPVEGVTVVPAAAALPVRDRASDAAAAPPEPPDGRTRAFTADEAWVLEQALADFAECESEGAFDHDEDDPQGAAAMRGMAETARSLKREFIERSNTAAAAPPEPVRPDPELPKGVERLTDGGLVCRGSMLSTLGPDWEWGVPGSWKPCTERPRFKHSATVIYDVRLAAAVPEAPEDATGDGEA